jgi:hypothetical protein
LKRLAADARKPDAAQLNANLNFVHSPAKASSDPSGLVK